VQINADGSWCGAMMLQKHS